MRHAMDHTLSDEPLLARVESLAGLSPGLHDRDFLATWRASDDAIRFVLEAASLLREGAERGLSLQVFDGGVGVSLFRDKSTRTRYAFRAACSLLGLSTEEIDESATQLAHGETVRETAAMLGFATEVFGIRDDMFLGEGHSFMEQVAASLEESSQAGILLGRPAVLNLQSDLDHPTQALADAAHLVEVFGDLEALRGKRVAMTWAYSPSYAKPLSVPQGIIGLLPRLGMDVVLAHPEGYELEPEALDAAARVAKAGGGRFRQVGSMREAFDQADIVYPKSWAPRRLMQERARCRREGRPEALRDLETQALAENAKHVRWTCDADLMSRTRGGAALYMHCLPADVTGVSCPAGEVSAEVFERARLDTYREARWKPFVIAAILLGTRFAEPANVLRELVTRAKPRRLTGLAAHR